MQRTVKNPIALSGKGLHSGQPAHLRILPGAADSGVAFRRTDVRGVDPVIPARWDNVSDTTLNTKLANKAGVSVSTIEHLMAAFAGCGVSNAIVEIDGPEVPILDGSARPFVQAILGAGLAEQGQPIRYIRVLKPVRVTRGDAYAELLPGDRAKIEFSIAFDDPAIGTQSLARDLSNGTFLRELCECRTFCRQADVDAMRKAGLALGGTYDNAVVVDGDRVLSPGGFRREDECVRHKMLDALGDLSLSGGPIIGTYRGEKAGHGLTNALLRKLFGTPDAYFASLATPTVEALLPGFDLTDADLRAVA